ncbi:ubiquitin carboxyl-terminal hydrolase 1 [Monodelphis domestica]|uniref:Ubiquitin carboxyl-terminal hydrolase n=1 Tax=Monodelphis domestica TaxID=13616 RepID=F7F488_MONDO|nr:ubiquitin carboxyl-terminal hydrolase 1 [Monodelphis domestica]XP_007480540.1 ubiquitin carboxyl-terminal hydrolase 1 [Monodelphis domestica]XP_016285359.1 ubiquitin carboxyl-terminal hydrolase 1 [Monodelphis domestica]
MPGVLPSESHGLLAARGSPKKSRLSLKFFQKKETKRALDFTGDVQDDEDRGPPEAGGAGGAAAPEVDQVVPATGVAQPSPLGTCDKRETLLPFVGLNNLGNTCYLNSILQVLYFCPGFKTGVKHLFNVITKKKEILKDETNQKVEKGNGKDDNLASYELICSLQSLIISVEQLQANFLLNPEKYTDELATQPRRLLNTLRELNPMYEGYLQHDAQEVLQCILGNIQETCQLLKKEELKNMPGELEEKPSPREGSEINAPDDDGVASSADGKDKISKGNGKRKSDSEVGNPKKKSKLTKEQTSSEENQRQTRSKRKATGDTARSESSPEATPKCATEGDPARPTQKKSRLKLNWLKPTTKQPSILSKFCSLGKITTHSGPKGHSREADDGDHEEDFKCEPRSYLKDESGEPAPPGRSMEDKETQALRNKGMEQVCFELVEKLFQGQLVLRTRCLECESLTERREDFQDISVPVQEEEFSKVEESSEISPEPKTELKSLKWAISQFASVERIVGEDKYFCENCHHYTEAERSLLFDKMPEVITIHLKCFAATGLEFDCYGGGLSKINTPLLTPLKLSLEEWSTKPTNDSYGLFAVVMHSGITISSGHYTASVKVTDLHSLELDTEHFMVDQTDEMGKPDPLGEEEAKALAEDYDDEVAFRVSGSSQASKVLNKKNVEAVGLLGGQKSKPDYEFYNSHKAANPEKVVGAAAESRNSESSSTAGAQELDRDKEPSGHMDAHANGPENKASYVLQSLKEYEGKWLLFDDSEVKVTEEKDFLNSLSPATSSTSTPYLLFYKKIIE